jgi:hypothetical protein
MDATLNSIKWGDKKHLLPVGLTSGEEYHAGVGATRNVETCNIACSMWTYHWMLRLTGEKSFSDRIEKIFFNAGPAPVSRDFDIMCYYQSMNRYSNKLPGAEPKHPGPDGSYNWNKLAHPILCCVGNINRDIPFYVMNMWMNTMDNGLAATLYGPCKVRSYVAGNVQVEIETKTAYPFEETIRLIVNPEKEVEFPVYLRVPEWCKNPVIEINGNSVETNPDGKDFVNISRKWKKNDEISLTFPMTVRLYNGNETPYPKLTYNKEYKYKDINMVNDTTINNPFVYLYYGPLLLSLPIPDENPNQEIPGTKFNYAINLVADSLLLQTEVIKDPMPETWNWPLNAPVKVKVRAEEFDWNPTEEQPLPKETVKGGKPSTITLVPYGCTKFRITMFPVTERTWSLLQKEY